MKSICALGLWSCLLLLCPQLNAQSKCLPWEIALGAGSAAYQGDLTPNKTGTFNKPGSSFQLSVSRVVHPSFSLRTNLFLIQLKGSDADYRQHEDRAQRNFGFTASLVELSGQLVWHMKNNAGMEEGAFFSPYLFAGISRSAINTTKSHGSFNDEFFATQTWVAKGLGADSMHQQPKAITAIPVGAGARFNFSDKISVFAEASQRITRTDYLDGFSQAANSKNNDHYSTVTIGMVYRLGVADLFDCPAVKR